MKRVRTMTVLALGWLGTAAPADDFGWKTADKPPVAPAPNAAKAPPLPVVILPEAMPWKTAPTPPVPIPPVAVPPVLPEPSSSVPPVPVAPLKGLEPLASPAVPPPAPPAPPTPLKGLEPLAPPVMVPPVDAIPQPLALDWTGPRGKLIPPTPTELPILPTPELPKVPATEPLPSPRPLPGSALNPQPYCNDTPDVPNPNAVKQTTAVSPAEAGIPVRNGTFGSPSVRLSRDYSFRDNFGLDLMRNERPIRVRPEGQPADSHFVQAEYLLWWANRGDIPVLATTSRDGTPGFLGQPGTQSLLGPGAFGPNLRSGFRVRAGGWLDDCGLRGIDGSFFFLGRTSTSFGADSAQYPTITRPFFAPNFNSEFGEIVAQPNLSSGRIDITSDSQLWGADINFRKGICRTCDRTTGWFAGYRYLDLNERLTIAESITSTGPLSPDPVGTKVFVQDRFEARNRFHGAQVGGFWSNTQGKLDWDIRAGIALGVNQETLQIDGLQQRTRPGQLTQSFNGGLLATGPNLGTFSQSQFSVVPEVTTTVGYRATPNLRVYVGYNVLYWSNVIRPGDAIDRTVDVALVPNPPAGVAATANPRPLPIFRQSDFWAQGIQFGIELRW